MDEEDKLLRKYRKKLRQIENLETLNRPLNEEEIVKVSLKDSLRNSIAEIMKRRKLDDKNDEDVVKTDDDKPTTASSDPPKTKRPCVEVSQVLINENLQEGSSEGEEKEEELEISTSTISPNPQTSVPSEPSSSSNEETIVTQKINVSTPSKKSAKTLSPSKEEIKPPGWMKKDFLLQDLTLKNQNNHHQDIIIACSIDQRHKLLITASRDTTLLVWSLITSELIASLRGHTDSVTCVVSVNSNESIKILADEDDVGLNASSEGLAISGSRDSTIKVWNILDGLLIKSIYTYNGINCLKFCELSSLAIVGTDGGKIEFYDLKVIDRKSSIYAGNFKNISHHAVTAMDLLNDTLCTGSNDGSTHVWTVPDFRCLFRPENINPPPNNRPILCLKFLHPGLIIYGDSGCNLKLLDWKKGTLKKISNHISDVGITDSLYFSSFSTSILISSSYDLDTGNGHLNVFRFDQDKNDVNYIGSLNDQESSRILAIDSLKVSLNEEEEITLATVGSHEVKLWKSIVSGMELPEEDIVIVRPRKLQLTKSPLDSGSSDEDLDDDENEYLSHDNERLSAKSKENNSWCLIS